MLNADDQALVTRDPQLPQLATLLDPTAMRDLVAAEYAEFQWATVRPLYVRYKPGTNCLVNYRGDTDAGSIPFYCKAFGDGGRAKLSKVQVGPPAPTDSPGIGRRVVPSQRLVLVPFPDDLRLAGLYRLWQRTGTEPWLSRLGSPTGSRIGDREVLGYRPERRCVTRWVAEDRPIVLRCYTAREYRAAKRTSKGLASQPDLQVPRRIGHSDRHGLLAFEWIEGHTVRLAGLSSGERRTQLARIASALAPFHEQPAHGLPVRDATDDARHVVAAAQGLRFLCPELGRLSDDITQRVVCQLGESEYVYRTIHGDLNSSQVVQSDTATALIDLDAAAVGDRMADLGSFAAHEMWRAICAGGSLSGAEEVAQLLWEAYDRTVHGSSWRRYRLQTAVHLLRITPHPFRDRHFDWPSLTWRLLEETRRLLDNPCGRRGSAIRLAVIDSSGAVRVDDPYGVTRDPQLAAAHPLLQPGLAERVLRNTVPRLGVGERSVLRAIRVTRHKPGRRCLIEFDLQGVAPHACESDWETLIGKVRGRGLARRTVEVQSYLFEHGFGPDSPDGIQVPEVCGQLPRYAMWLQRKVPGVSATYLLQQSAPTQLARRMAEAIFRLHACQVPTHRAHTLNDELRILGARLDGVTAAHPDWEPRLQRILADCGRLASRTPAFHITGIHRDFYADQLVMDGRRIWLVDLDLVCCGDAALDVGNFCGHLIEHGLRHAGRPDAWGRYEQSFLMRYAELAGPAVIPAAEMYTTLTLVRHLSLSRQLPRRQHTTEPLMALCERRLSRQLSADSRGTQTVCGSPESEDRFVVTTERK